MSSKNKTPKLDLSQFTANDEPKWLTDYNNDMLKVDNYIGKVTRTATVVVGLESMGYTANQVDVHIKPSDNVTSKIVEAINKLPNLGGEIKLLEGEYNLSNRYEILKENVCIRGCGTATKVTGWIISANNVEIADMSLGAGLDITEITVATNVDNLKINSCTFASKKAIYFNSNVKEVYVSNCNSITKTGDVLTSWRNIYIDGVAEILASNTTLEITDTAISAVTAQEQDEIIIGLFVTNVGHHSFIVPSNVPKSYFSQFYARYISSTFYKYIVAGTLTDGEFMMWCHKEVGMTEKIIIQSIVLRRYLK